MNNSSFSTTFQVAQPPAEVFNAINDVRGWWASNIDGNTTNLNDTFTVNFEEHWWTFKINELVPNKKIVWLVTGSYMPWNEHKTEWINTKIVFDITKEGDRTRVHFTHEGLVPQFACFKGCSKGWTGYIQESLQNWITTGKGNPDYPY